MKLSTLVTEYNETRVLGGSRFGFWWAFWSTKLFSFLRQHSRLMQRVVPRVIAFLPTASYVIENTVGRFRVQAYDDSTTICSGYFEAHLRPWLDYPPEKQVFVDIGANRGLYAILALRQHGYTSTHSFEPNPLMSAILQENLQLNELTDRAVHHPYGLGEVPGMVTFTVDPLHAGGGRVVDDATNTMSTTQVEVTTLDTALSGVPPATISFIKIDTEGFEMAVLRGASIVLAGMTPGACVMIESTDSTALCDYLAPYNFTLKTSTAHDHLFQKHA